jgi:ribonuclease Z
MRITFLGTGGVYPTKTRALPAIAVRVEDELVLFDCGEGTQRQFIQSQESFMKVSRVFITHQHADHVLGIPGLIQTMTLNDRKEPLYFYGPPGTKAMIEVLSSFGNAVPFEIHAHELEPGDVVACRRFLVHTAKGEHTARDLAYAVIEPDRPGRFYPELAERLGVPEGPMYRKLQKGETVQIGGRSITPEMVMGEKRPGRKVVYSGDTRPCKEVTRLASGCDLLIHDSTHHPDDAGNAEETGHSTSEGAAGVARDAGARRLVLYHISPRYEDVAPLLENARKVFAATDIFDDLTVLEIEKRDK